ncbi:hypothetical protein ASD04_10775 [Devosia sp. Root436]|jgi:tripartite-type tricarboxylate transporter receptor subunit TctC|uniref:Bug family tripartite tricarboxylate transporter substrate binding protein n=1 Tax=Devosia sp. Root436 TaxID=1736537 RepID=UPI0006FB5653|nr:tripartite tricarboxylate transporter substrate binding protein [Devosia sp. Root436]KQX38104.1 hypothetical protein ASD04_10775 [Devosia sp. Root436]
MGWSTIRAAGLAVTMAALGATTALAQDWPSRDITFIIPYAPGGGTDMLAQEFTRKLSDVIGATVIIDYRPGGSGSVGTGIAVRAPADGYTVAMVSNGNLTMSPLTIPGLPWDGIDDYVVLGKIGDQPVVLAARSDAEWSTLEEYIAFAKSRPGNVHAATSGQLTPSGLGVEMLNAQADLDVVAIPMSGGAESLTQLLGGHVDALFSYGPAIKGQVDAGELKPVTVFSTTPYPFFADTGLAQDAGYNIDLGTKFYLIAPKDLPQDIAEKLRAATLEVTAQDDFQAFLANNGYVKPAELDAAGMVEELKAEERLNRDALTLIGQEPVL